MNGYERIRAHCEWLGLIGMPPDRVGALEAKMVRAWAKWQRERRAEAALVADGATVAAEHLGCDRVTVYRRARKLRELRKTATA